MPTGIPYVDEVLNVTAGCQRVSEGCEHCWAELSARRLARNPSVKEVTRKAYQSVAENGRWNGKVALLPERLKEPFGWGKPRWILVNSMSDLFHDGVPSGYIAALFGVIAAYPQHQFLLLTKRPERMIKWLEWLSDFSHHCDEKAGQDKRDWIGDTRLMVCRNYAGCWVSDMNTQLLVKVGQRDWPLPNVWLGATIENQQRAEERLRDMSQLAAMGWNTWVSIEPMLGPIDFDEVPVGMFGPLRPGLGHLKPRVQWVIVGDESGPNRRSCELDWVRLLRDQCRVAGVPFYLKQLHTTGRRVEMPELDGEVHSQMPVKPGAEAPGHPTGVVAAHRE